MDVFFIVQIDVCFLNLTGLMTNYFSSLIKFSRYAFFKNPQLQFLNIILDFFICNFFGDTIIFVELNEITTGAQSAYDFNFISGWAKYCYINLHNQHTEQFIQHLESLEDNLYTKPKPY